jgi:uncharacterized membrane protein YhdT
MRFLRWLVNFLAATIVVLVSLYLVVAVCVLALKLTGQLSDGPMYFELQTPTYQALLLFQGICIAIISLCFAVRTLFGRKNDFSFLRQWRSKEGSK